MGGRADEAPDHADEDGRIHGQGDGERKLWVGSEEKKEKTESHKANESKTERDGRDRESRILGVREDRYLHRPKAGHRPPPKTGRG